MGESQDSTAFRGAGIVLCADDFGLNRWIDQAIIDLVAQGRLTAVSCMANGPCLDADLPELVAAAAVAPLPVEIGLHTTLTEYHAISPLDGLAPDGQLPQLRHLMADCFRGRINRPGVQDEIARQMEKLSTALGRTPDFLDGHQHVHLLPGIRDAVAGCWSAWADPPRWIRSCSAPARDLLGLPQARAKAAFLAGLTRMARANSPPTYVSTNSNFYGVSSFEADKPYGRLMRSWLGLAARSPLGAVIMCHPGHAPDANVPCLPDPIASARVGEFAYLSSDAFVEDLRATGAQERFGVEKPGVR